MVKQFTKLKYLVLISVPLVLQISCARDNGGEKSRIILQTPSTAKVSAKGIQAQAVDLANMCFAILVRGQGIPEVANGCGMSVGAHSSMVKGGGEISLVVNRGSGRIVELVRYEMPVGVTTCPNWSPANCSNTAICSTYSSGVSASVDMSGSQTEVVIELDLSSSVSVANGGICGSGSLQMALTSAGNIVNEAGVVVDGASSSPRLSSISVNGSSLETWNLAGESNAGLTVPSYVRSITRKPDTKQLYGLVGLIN